MRFPLHVLFFCFLFFATVNAQEETLISYRSILDGQSPPPAGWTFQKKTEASPQQLFALSQKLGGKIVRLLNTLFLYENKNVLINLLDCESDFDTEILYKRFLEIHKENTTFVLRDQRSIIEFSRVSYKTAVRAHYDLGFKPKKVTYQVSFSVAPLQTCNYMQWNLLFNLFLNFDQKNLSESSEIVEASAHFRFGNTLHFRNFGQGPFLSTYTFSPVPVKTERDSAREENISQFQEMPLKAGVPSIQVQATIVSEAFALTPTSRQSELVLLQETPFWPSTDSTIVALAQEITKNASTPQQKVEALLEWLEPGKNIHYGGEQKGSRYGTLHVFAQKFGRCWDFSDCFITLCRAIHLPARQVLGWWYGNGGHVWVEVLLEGQGWFAVDPTANMACTSEYVPFLHTETGDISFVYTSMVNLKR